MRNLTKVIRSHFFSAMFISFGEHIPIGKNTLIILITAFPSFHLFIFNDIYTSNIFYSWFHEIPTERPRLNVVQNLAIICPTFYPGLPINKIMFIYASRFPSFWKHTFDSTQSYLLTLINDLYVSMFIVSVCKHYETKYHCWFSLSTLHIRYFIGTLH